MNASKREKILNGIGLGLLALCFCLSLGRIFGRMSRRDDQDGRTTIRFSHWQLEGGVRDAFDHLGAEYMRLHPEVRVEQIPIPESVYPNWLRTQLVGGTAPELIETRMSDNSEILANYFEPITPYLEAPNPYNKNNDLARTPWRNTFLDGLSHSYNQELLQYYGIPNSMTTIRMYYNRPLWRAVFGSEEGVPQTYEEMVERCQRIAAYRTAAGERIVPIAGASSNAPFLVGRLFSNQTQQLLFSFARPGSLFPTNEEIAMDFLDGKWSFHTPAVRDGLELARGIGQFLPAGFLQLRREDALFTFSQGRALMTVTGSWDATSIHSQAPFPVGVFEVPVPTRENPRYGHNVLGPASEASTGTSLVLGMTKQSSAAKRARVIDFLHFLSSRDGNAEFSRVSGWLPTVVGVQVEASLKPFLPRTAGYPNGFGMNISQSGSEGSPRGEVNRVQDAAIYRLFEPDGGPDAFAAAIEPDIRTALIRDLNTAHRNQIEIIVNQDTTLGAYHALGRANAPAEASGSGEADWSGKFSELNELQTQEEIAVATRRSRFRHRGLSFEQ